EVVRAGQEAETSINQATQYANEVVPRARGQAAQITQAAEAYREQAIREANGEAQRFTLVEQQYRAAPRVTRDRLYLESMERIYGAAETVIIDRNAGAVPILPLDQLRRSNTPAPAANAPQAAPGAR
ncbi:MAG: FtsH protease activity modulator HflK, partial [Caulobacterales bacterium]